MGVTCLSPFYRGTSQPQKAVAVGAGYPSGYGTVWSAHVFFQLMGSDLRYPVLVMIEHHCS